jgi:hypothetical protein
MLPLWSSVRINHLIPQQNLVLLSERILSSNCNELTIRGQENDFDYNVIFPSLTELDSHNSSSISHSACRTNKTVRQSYFSESSSSDSYFGIPCTISASSCLTSSIASPRIGVISSSTSLIVDRFHLSREERLSMIKQLIISFVAEKLSPQDPVHTHYSIDNSAQSPQHSTHYDTENDITSLSCYVCSSQFQHGERISMNPNCSHIFHEECLFKHLIIYNKCPKCKDPFLRSIVNPLFSS